MWWHLVVLLDEGAAGFISQCPWLIELHYGGTDVVHATFLFVLQPNRMHSGHQIRGFEWVAKPSELSAEVSPVLSGCGRAEIGSPDSFCTQKFAPSRPRSAANSGSERANMIQLLFILTISFGFAFGLGFTLTFTNYMSGFVYLNGDLVALLRAWP